MERDEVAADVGAANDEATDQHAGIFVSGSEQVSKNKIKKKKQLPVNMVNSNYNLFLKSEDADQRHCLLTANSGEEIPQERRD